MKYKVQGQWIHIAIDSLFCETIQDFFNTYIPSKKIQHQLIQNKQILIDGNACKRESDIVGIYLSILLYNNESDYPKYNNKINIVYEDDFVVCVNKPKDLLVHSDGSDVLTLTDMVKSYYSDKAYLNIKALHRLDKDTKGLVLFSKSYLFQPLLDQYMANKQIRRSYLALCFGNDIKNNSFVIDKPIGKDRHISNKMVISKTGDKAITKVLCLGNYQNYCMLRCNLLTGKTHQIRVHLSSINHGIVNDELYASQANVIKTMGLFADSIEMYHPIIEEMVNIEIEAPDELAIIMNKLK